MSIICKEIPNSPLIEKAAYKEISKFVRATIDPKTYHHLPFPSDYKFSECFLAKNCEKTFDQIHNFTIRKDDIWILSIPKAGSTWMQNIVWQLKNNLDFSAEAISPSYQYFEYAALHENNGNKEFRKNIEIDRFDKLPSPRIIKSHLPAHLLPKALWTVQPKMIYLVRNPKDSVVSFYHLFKNTADYTGSIEEFFEIFINDHVLYTPIQDHALSFWQLRQHSANHLLFLNYEELWNNPFDNVKKVSAFLGYSYTDQQMKQLIEHLSFHNMREKVFIQRLEKTVNPNYRFCRKGRNGSYRDEMSAEWEQLFDKWTAERLKNTDFEYKKV